MFKPPNIPIKRENISENPLRMYQDYEFFKDDVLFDSLDEDYQNPNI